MKPPAKKSALAIMIGIGKPKSKPNMGDDDSANSANDSNDPNAAPDEGGGHDNPDSQSTEHDEAAEMESSCIPLPKGLKLPDNVGSGQEFSGTFKGRIQGGKLYLDAINDIPTEGSKAEEESENPNDELAEQEEESEVSDRPQPTLAPSDAAMEEDGMDEEDKAYNKKLREKKAFSKVFN